MSGPERQSNREDGLSDTIAGVWHCYSVAGAAADAKAITRLVPRRENRRDRDVAKAITRRSIFLETNAVAGVTLVFAEQHRPGRASGSGAS